MFARLGTVSRRVGSLARNSLAIIGVGTTFYGIREYKQYKEITTVAFDHDNGDDSGDDKGSGTNSGTKKRRIAKKVLVLPFHKMKIVERKNPGLEARNKLKQLLSGSGGSSGGGSDEDDTIQEVDIQTLINVIHEAALDPEIVALYGTFGNGFRFDCGGYAHVEEIRNAIRVFNESHRSHYDINSNGTTSSKNRTAATTRLKGHDEKEQNEQQQQQPMQKYSYAFADTFDHPTDSGNKEYFLASAFSNIQMQPRGNLNLFGVSTSNTFLYGALEKYGIKAHVFKHGKYKNAPNALTEYGYTKAHLENTKSIIESINHILYSSITHSRNLHNTFDHKVWQSVHEYGTLSAVNAQEVNLIDYTPRIDPLTELVELVSLKTRSSSSTATMNNNVNDDETNNQNDIDNERFDYLKKRWTWLNSNDQQFIANQIISLNQYTSILTKRDKWTKKEYKLNQMLQTISEQNSIVKGILSGIMGYNAPYYNIDEKKYDRQYIQRTKEKIAIVHINGGINDAMARNVVKSLRQIKKDNKIKAVIFRVDSPGGSVIASETILEECKDMQKPIICSFANVAASGGYYVSAYANRIFASPTTLTGSIGVFGIKFDATELARSYGVDVNFVSSGTHAPTYNIFHPLTKQMKINLERNMDTVYAYFKEIVSRGRNIPLAKVEEIAKGRVWTGEQAKEIGLVDEIGGLQRAILYAKREHTTNGLAEVEVWPKPQSLQDRLMKLSGAEIEALVSDTPSVLDNDKNLVQLILNGKISPSTLFTGLPLTSGVLLTIDETTAVQLMLKEAVERGE